MQLRLHGPPPKCLSNTESARRWPSGSYRCYRLPTPPAYYAEIEVIVVGGKRRRVRVGPVVGQFDGLLNHVAVVKPHLRHALSVSEGFWFLLSPGRLLGVIDHKDTHHFLVRFQLEAQAIQGAH
jgi:hypothetical protein